MQGKRKEIIKPRQAIFEPLSLAAMGGRDSRQAAISRALPSRNGKAFYVPAIAALLEPFFFDFLQN